MKQQVFQTQSVNLNVLMERITNTINSIPPVTLFWMIDENLDHVRHCPRVNSAHFEHEQ